MPAHYQPQNTEERILLEESKNPNGHPCPDYFTKRNHELKERRINDDNFRTSFKRSWSENTGNSESIHTNPTRDKEEGDIPESWQATESKKNNKQKGRMKAWFQSKGYSERRVNKNRLLTNIAYTVILAIGALIVSNNLSTINEIAISFIRVGSVVMLILLGFIVRYIYFIFKQLRNGHANLKNGYKLILILIAITLLIYIYLDSTVIPRILQIVANIQFGELNPISNNLSTSVGILPAPWGVLAFYGVIALIGSLLLRRYAFDGYFPTWFKVVAGIIALIFLLQYHIPYKQVPVTINAHCQDNKFYLDNNMMGFGSIGLATQCIEYKSSGCLPICVENNPVCQCQAVPLDILLRQPGDWFFDYFQ